MTVSSTNSNVEYLGLTPILRWPTVQSRIWTENFLASARNDDNVVAVIAVGSAVRLAVASVDLDLIVISKEPDKLRYKPPIEIDLRVYAADKVHSLIQSGNDMLGWAVMYGKVILQRDAYWDLVLRSWRSNVPLPSADIAIERARSAFHRFSRMIEAGDQDAAYEQALSCVTHLARAELLKRNRYPASRPELPKDLRAQGNVALADALEALINRTTEKGPRQLAEMLESLLPSNTDLPTVANSATKNTQRRL